MNCKLIIQARMSSTRMPKKILLPFYEKKGILEWQIERLLTQFKKEDIIVATTTNIADQPIADLCQQIKIKHFRGSEQNVLGRFIDCATEYNLTSLVRICSDNTFIDVTKVRELISFSEKSNYDYISQSVNNTPGIKTHYGIWSEWVSVDALIKAEQKTNEPLYLEHVTNYIYTNPKSFNCHFFDIDLSNQPQIRLTTDTKEDFELQQKIFKKLMSIYGIDFSTTHIFDLIDKHPEYLDVMTKQIKLNAK